VLELMGPDRKTNYWLDSNVVYYVPKYSLGGIIVGWLCPDRLR